MFAKGVEMNIDEFNEKYKGKFRYVKKNTQTKDHTFTPIFRLEQWCEKAQKYCRMLMPGYWQSLAKDECVPQELIDNLNNIFVIVVNGKYGDCYYRAFNSEDIGLFSLQFLQEKLDDGLFGVRPKPEPPKYQPTDFEDDSELKLTCSQQHKEYQQLLKDHESSLKIREFVDRALKERDYALAFSLVNERTNYEYERFSIERLLES